MGTLYIVSTPIGNREDLSPRARKILESVAVVLCEDTRRTGLLIHNRLLSYYDEIEDKRIPEVIELLQTNDVALASDAGTPLISDPGFRLVRECIKCGIKVQSIPGPSAMLAALTSSGLPPDKFTFLGYPPEKQQQRLKLFNDLVSMNRFISSTYIFYCAPHKFVSTINDLKSILGDVEIVIARELTKVHEEIWRGKISDAFVHFTEPKGEFVLLLYLP